jgi:RNA-directed DNA polymerase
MSSISTCEPTFDTVRHHIVLEKVARRVNDDEVLCLLKLMLKASGKRGVPRGGIVSPLLSNLYLNEVDKMLERAQQVTRWGRWTAVEYARFADDLVILVDSHARYHWLRRAVEQRLREELAKLQVEVNEEKSRRLDLSQGDGFGFLGFEFRRIRSRRGRWMPLRTPKKEETNGSVAQAQGGLPKLDLATGHESDRANQSDSARLGEVLFVWSLQPLFLLRRDWVEKKIRCHLARARERRGHAWKRCSREWLYSSLGLFADYRVSY